MLKELNILNQNDEDNIVNLFNIRLKQIRKMKINQFKIYKNKCKKLTKIINSKSFKLKQQV